jgi:hypothetical protein
MEQARFAELLRKLASNHVEFVVVGMMAGVLSDLGATYRHDPRGLSRASRTS